MIPSPANPASIAKIPSHKTTIPADLKKSGAYCDFANFSVLNERRARIGKVPSANDTIISHPLTNDPLESAVICMDCVKPQGRKNVAKPIIMGVSVLCSIFLSV